MYKFFPLLFLIISNLFAYEDNKYTLGEGLQVGSLPLYIGGYISLDYKHQQDYDSYRIDDLSFLVYGSQGKLSYLSEIEYKEFYVKTKEDGITTTQTNTEFLVERLFATYTLNENTSLRGGKYDSYVGYWNLIPINVLRETTSNPMSTYILYPKYTTGIETLYKNYNYEGVFGLEVSIQNNNDLDNEYNNYIINKHYALSLEYEQDLWSIKFNGGYFHIIDTTTSQKKRYYMMFSTKIEESNYQILAEVGTQQDNHHNFTTQYAGYIQGLYRFHEKHITVIRYESFFNEIIDKKDNFLVMGYTFRPLYPIAIKGEYQIHKESKDNAAFISFSVLF